MRDSSTRRRNRTGEEGTAAQRGGTEGSVIFFIWSFLYSQHFTNMLEFL
jgi:hypothetical protein